jgi:hypothetical protein
MRDSIVLLSGVAAVATILGYMIGGSATPVVSVAVPAIFGLVLSAIGLFQRRHPSQDFLEFIRRAGSDAEAIPEVAEYRRSTRLAEARIGYVLITFSLFYLAGTVVGSKVRIDGLLAREVPAPPFPWSQSEPPKTLEAATGWIALQHRLIQLGYTEQQIASLYAVQLQEVKEAERLQQANQPSPAPPASGPAKTTPTRKRPSASTPAASAAQTSNLRQWQNPDFGVVLTEESASEFKRSKGFGFSPIVPLTELPSHWSGIKTFEDIIKALPTQPASNPFARPVDALSSIPPKSIQGSASSPR